MKRIVLLIFLLPLSLTLVFANNEVVINSIENNDIETLNYFISEENVNNVFSYYSQYYTPLSFATLREAETDVIEILLDKGADPNGAGSSKTPLYYACDNNDDDIVELLIDSGANVNELVTPYSTTYSLLAYAIAMEWDDTLIEKIIAKGADVNGTGSDKSPLYYACDNNDEDIVELLIDSGANINELVTPYSTTYSLLAYAIAMEWDDTLIKKIIAKGADINGTGSDKSPLYYACDNNDEDIVELLIDAGANINELVTPYSITYSLLAYAITMEWDDTLIEKIIEKGADVNGTGSDKSPLFYACDNNDKSIAELLVDSGANVNGTISSYGTTYSFLSFAVDREWDNALIKKMIDKGADVNGTGSDKSPLFYACDNNDESIAELLIDSGADVNGTISSYGTTYSFLSFAVDREWDNALIKKMIDKGADVNGTGSDKSPLFYACDNNNESIIKLLVESGANTNETISLYGTTYTLLELAIDRMWDNTLIEKL